MEKLLRTKSKNIWEDAILILIYFWSIVFRKYLYIIKKFNSLMSFFIRTIVSFFGEAPTHNIHHTFLFILLNELGLHRDIVFKISLSHLLFFHFLIKEIHSPLPKKEANHYLIRLMYFIDWHFINYFTLIILLLFRTHFVRFSIYSSIY